MNKTALLSFALIGPMIFGLTGCLGAKKQESWNSYYYGGYQEINGKFTYEDNDSQYTAPVRRTVPPHSLEDHSDDTMLDDRWWMRRIDGRNTNER